MGDLQDPKLEVLYHMFGHILWGYSLKFRPFIMVGTSNQSDPESWPLKYRTWGIFMGTEMMKHWRYDVDIKWGFHGVSEWAYIDYTLW